MITGRARRMIRQGWNTRRALRQAQRLVDDDRPAAAARLLAATVLSGHDPDSAMLGEDLVSAAAVYVLAASTSAAGLDADPAPTSWAGYLYRTADEVDAASPVLILVQRATDTLAEAMRRAGRGSEAVAAGRASVRAAARLGDADGETDRRLRLAVDLHTIGQCAEAHHEAATVIGRESAGHPVETPVALATVVAVFAMLESCHRHDEANTLAARISPERVVIEDYTGDEGIGSRNPPDGFTEHPIRHHAGDVCDRPDCPVDAGGRAFSARLYAALLSGHDPAVAAPHSIVELLAGMFVALPEADRQTAASASGWADYLCRSAVIRAAHDTGTPPFTAGTDGAPVAADESGDIAGWEHLARLAASLIIDADDLFMAVTARIRLAGRLHRNGRCEDGLAEARAALDMWQAVEPGVDDRHLTHRIRVAVLLGGCHRHDEARQIIGQLDPALRPDGSAPVARWFWVYEQTRIAMPAHARVYHPDHPCDVWWCRSNLAAAADLPHVQLLGALTPLHQQGRSAQLLPALAAHLAGFDPADSPPGAGLAGLAVMYAWNTVADPISQPADTVLGWARYACRAAEALDAEPGPFWAVAHTALQHAAMLYDARDQAVDAARALLGYHTRPGAADTAADVTARLDLGEALHTAGRCADATEHARAAWAKARQQLHPDDPDECQAGLLAGIDAAFLLGDCHHHREAVAVLTDAVQHFRPIPASGGDSGDAEHGDGDDGDAVWRDEIAGFSIRSDRHDAEFHRDDPCQGGRHAVEMAAAVAVLSTAPTAGPAADRGTP